MTSLIRLLLILALGVNTAAIVLGGLGPAPRPNSWHPAPQVRYQAIDQKDQGIGSPMLLHDLEAERLVRLDLGRGLQLQHAASSPFRDLGGESQVVGLLISRSYDGPFPTSVDFKLARMSYPSGRYLDRVATDRMPTSPPCWYPGMPDRILFASGDGRLYHHTFRAKSGPSAGVDDGIARPKAVIWQTAPPGFGGVNLDDPTWPADPRWGGRIVVSLSYMERPGAKQFGSDQLWWLGLNAGGTGITTAGRLLGPETQGDGMTSAATYLVPTTNTCGGQVTLAFLKVPPEGGRRILCLATVEFDPSTSAPIVRPESIRELAAGSGLTTPAFSPDGRWISCVLDPLKPSVRLARFSVEAALGIGGERIARRPDLNLDASATGMTGGLDAPKRSE